MYKSLLLLETFQEEVQCWYSHQETLQGNMKCTGPDHFQTIAERFLKKIQIKYFCGKVKLQHSHMLKMSLIYRVCDVLDFYFLLFS